jgi:hypothetical protein
MVSLEFFIDIILPIALWLWGRLSLWRNVFPVSTTRMPKDGGSSVSLCKFFANKAVCVNQEGGLLLRSLVKHPKILVPKPGKTVSLGAVVQSTYCGSE